MSLSQLNVALVTPWETGGGIANYSERLKNALETVGHSVTVVPIRNPQSRNPWGFRDIIRRIPSETDVVHVQFEAGVFGRFLVSGVCAPSFYLRLERADWPLVTTLHEVHRDYQNHSMLGATVVGTRDWLVERLVLSVSDATVIHTSEAESVLRNRHSDFPRIERLRHPVDEPIAPPMDTAQAREELNITADIVLLTFGWVESKKRYQDVVRCLPDFPDAEYLIAGEPRHEEDTETLNEVFELAASLGVRDRIRHLGYVPEEDLPTLFGATDLTVVPYEQVTQSGAANTALAYRCPVVATELPAFDELASEYECVMTYEDPESLCELIRDATSDNSLARFRESAKFYNEIETWDRFAEDTASLYVTVATEQTKNKKTDHDNN